MFMPTRHSVVTNCSLGLERLDITLCLFAPLFAGAFHTEVGAERLPPSEVLHAANDAARKLSGKKPRSVTAQVHLVVSVGTQI